MESASSGGQSISQVGRKIGKTTDASKASIRNWGSAKPLPGISLSSVISALPFKSCQVGASVGPLSLWNPPLASDFLSNCFASAVLLCIGGQTYDKPDLANVYISSPSWLELHFLKQAPTDTHGIPDRGRQKVYDRGLIFTCTKCTSIIGDDYCMSRYFASGA